MLDEQHRQLVVVTQPQDEVPELLHLLVVEAAGRLVEQQQPRLRGERAGDLDPLLDPVGQRGGELAGPAAEADVVQRRARLLSRRRARPRACAPTRTFSSTDIDVNRLMFWKVRAIPRSTTRCAGVCSSDVAVELEPALVRRVEPGDHVERRRLAGAVRADQARDLPRLDLERDSVEGDDAPEAQGDSLNRQQASPLCRSEPTRSRGQASDARRGSGLRGAQRGAQSAARPMPPASSAAATRDEGRRSPLGASTSARRRVPSRS